MADVLANVVSFGREFAAVLPTKASDPVAWGALTGALVLGSMANPRRPLALALGWGLLSFLVLMLESVYFFSPLTLANSAALASICVVGVAAGRLLRSSFSRRGAPY